MGRKHYIIPIFVPHKGCPHDCIFCNQKRITGTDGENITGEFVESTIHEYLNTIKEQDAFIEVSFFGGSFTAIPMDYQNELMNPAKKALDKGLIDAIRLSTRPDYIDDRILLNLKEHGAGIIELGVQSLNDEVLQKSGRGHTRDDVIKASRLIKDYGFVLGHQVMLGLPSDNEKKDIATVKESISMGPDICRIYPALVIKNTPMETMFYRGNYKPYSLERTVSICKILYSLYSASGIQVIRIGLQPTDNINVNGDVVAGPFHPAIRELVEGSLLNDMLYQSLKGYTGECVIYISDRYISRLYADKKLYYKNLLEKLPDCRVKVECNRNIKEGRIVVNKSGKDTNLELASYMKALVSDI